MAIKRPSVMGSKKQATGLRSTHSHWKAQSEKDQVMPDSNGFGDRLFLRYEERLNLRLKWARSGKLETTISAKKDAVTKVRGGDTASQKGWISKRKLVSTDRPRWKTSVLLRNLVCPYPLCKMQAKDISKKGSKEIQFLYSWIKKNAPFKLSVAQRGFACSQVLSSPTADRLVLKTHLWSRPRRDYICYWQTSCLVSA